MELLKKTKIFNKIKMLIYSDDENYRNTLPKLFMCFSNMLFKPFNEGAAFDVVSNVKVYVYSKRVGLYTTLSHFHPEITLFLCDGSLSG